MALVKEGVLITRNQGNPLRLEVLTDFEIPQDGSNVREYIYFNDNGNERWHNIKDQGALRRIDMRVQIQFQDLSTLPLVIMPGHEVNVKLGWRRKKANYLLQITDPDRQSI
jgi:hypothetical protein